MMLNESEFKMLMYLVNSGYDDLINKNIYEDLVNKLNDFEHQNRRAEVDYFELNCVVANMDVDDDYFIR